MAKKIIIPAVFFILILGVLYFLFGQNGNLISPLFSSRDQTSLISAKISSAMSLDFSRAKTLSTLDTVPRYLVYNPDTLKVYYEKNSQVSMSPASFTKLLSSMVALDLVSPDTLIEATPTSINKVPTVLGLKAGEKLTVSELIRGSIATSANDASQTLAEGVAKNIKITYQEFIYYMNKKAELMGMTHSHFKNPDGLDDKDQYTTLTDLAKLVRNTQQNYQPILKAGSEDRNDLQATPTHGFYYLPNWNGLLGIYRGVNGLKIAYTEEAGYSTIVTAEKEGVKMVALVSGTSSYLERDRAAADLLDAGFMAEGLAPEQITKTKLNQKYKQWGDLARHIRSEMEKSQ